MSNTAAGKPSTEQGQVQAKTRKPYHTPKLETYGAVSVLTRAGTPPGPDDGLGGYNSAG